MLRCLQSLSSLLSRALRSPRGAAVPAQADDHPLADSEPSRAGWTADDWARVRAPERHRDRELSAAARRWLDRLPADAAPRELAARYPRIVNRLAALWSDAGLTEQLLHELLHDTRGGRQGFPPEIAGELQLLREVHDARVDAVETVADRWPATQS